MAAKYGMVYRTMVLGETSLSALGPEANELLLFDQAKTVFLHLWLGNRARPAVSARADAAGFRRASACIAGRYRSPSNPGR